MRVFIAALLPFLFAASVIGQPTTRITRGDLQAYAPIGSVHRPAISSDGRFVAFLSAAQNFVPGDSNFADDVYLVDLQSSALVRASLPPSGQQPDRACEDPVVSGDGTLVFFLSQATNLVPGDTGFFRDLFVYHVATGSLQRLSVSSMGQQANGETRSYGISEDGRFAALESEATNLDSGDTNGRRDIFLHDRQAGLTTRVSLAWNGAEANHHSSNPALSADGRLLVFESLATNLLPGADGDFGSDVFLRDLTTGAIEKLSLSTTGAVGNDSSSFPSVSADGSRIAFTSRATNLVPGDTNQAMDVFVRDRLSGTTHRVSVSSTGAEADARSFDARISGDGRFVVFASYATNLVPGDTNGSPDIFRHDTWTGVTDRLSVDSTGMEGDGISRSPTITFAGALVAFESDALLDPRDGNPSYSDVLLRDVGSATTALLPLFSEEANSVSRTSALSTDGRFVAFASHASNLVVGDSDGTSSVFRLDRETRVLDRMGAGLQPSISAAGDRIAFVSDAADLVPNDTNGVTDAFVFDFTSGILRRVSVATNGTQANDVSDHPVLSADGRFVAFASRANNLIAGDSNGLMDVFVHDLTTATTVRGSVSNGGAQGNGSSWSASLSGDGRLLAFSSSASNLLPGDVNDLRDVFVRDLVTGATRLVSAAGAPANARSEWPVVSSNGQWVVYSSQATNLVPNDTNGSEDIFLYELLTNSTVRVSVDSLGFEGDGQSERPRLSGDGRIIAFQSDATNLVVADLNGATDVFVHDRETGVTEIVSVDSRDDFGNAASKDPALSADGRWVSFTSEADNLVLDDRLGMADVFLRDRAHLVFQGTPAPAQPVRFSLSGAFGEAGHDLLVLLSCTGTDGLRLPGDGRMVRLTPDACTTLGLQLSIFLRAPIDGSGKAQTPIVPFPLVAPGRTFYAAGVTIDPLIPRFVAITGPISVVTQ